MRINTFAAQDIYLTCFNYIIILNEDKTEMYQITFLDYEERIEWDELRINGNCMRDNLGQTNMA